jgi:subtilisin family serine protease
VLVFLIVFFVFNNLNNTNKESEKANFSEDIKVQWNIKLLDPYMMNSGRSEGRTKVKIAILDSGINQQHQDLKGIVKKEYNAVTPKRPVTDDFGHGTAVAGIIGARQSNKGITSYNHSGVELYDVKVLNQQGKGDVESLIKGIEWSIKEGVHIINISSGVVTNKAKLKSSIDKAVSHGIIIVAAAGNTYGTGVEYPAKYTNVISVNSIKKNLKRPSSAARGKIDYIAPGVDILSTNHRGEYSLFTGTSFAAAHVTGVTSLYVQDYLSKSKKLNVDELMKKLKQESRKVQSLNDDEQGNGLLIYNHKGA